MKAISILPEIAFFIFEEGASCECLLHTRRDRHIS